MSAIAGCRASIRRSSASTQSTAVFIRRSIMTAIAGARSSSMADAPVKCCTCPSASRLRIMTSALMSFSPFSCSMSCQVTPTGLVEQIPFSFGFGTIGPKKDRHASFIHAGAPGIVGKDSYGNHMDGNGMVGSKRLNNGRWWVNFQVWCSMW
ncbi:hypothetical protein BDZ90DRAFT_89358 [Jaminaea rosea]|uniref:Uncharacterized protein n=1 Tax=Jaminaea rosea TaxID=1569628 RepID=A0A316UP45_9BASI|nr:hypothetical protein BDZ90DRAFT_89358 [Jaminaea rosea]PWN24935.1 hypothetical protein BDZ90DRAFT_89358 [Jaminaea rosea]